MFNQTVNGLFITCSHRDLSPCQDCVRAARQDARERRLERLAAEAEREQRKAELAALGYTHVPRPDAKRHAQTYRGQAPQCEHTTLRVKSYGPISGQRLCAKCWTAEYARTDVRKGTVKAAQEKWRSSDEGKQARSAQQARRRNRQTSSEPPQEEVPNGSTQDGSDLSASRPTDTWPWPVPRVLPS
jgi:hypothetical protein